jgi:hypothetical protein
MFSPPEEKRHEKLPILPTCEGQAHLACDRPDEALFVAGIGRRYIFIARGRTADGVWTADAPYSQAWTVLE